MTVYFMHLSVRLLQAIPSEMPGKYWKWPETLLEKSFVKIQLFFMIKKKKKTLNKPLGKWKSIPQWDTTSYTLGWQFYIYIYIYTHTHTHTYIKRKITSAGEDVEESEPLHIADRNIKCYNC